MAVGNPNYDFETAPPFTAAQTTDNWIDGTATGSSTNVYGWWASPRATAIAVQFDSTVSFSGTYSLKISTTNTTGRARIWNAKGSAGSLVANSTQQPYLTPVTPGGTYTMTAQVKTNNVAAGGASIGISEFNSSFVVGTTTGSSGLTGTNNWTFQTATVTVSATTNWVALGLSNDVAGNVSDAWFDAITFTGTGLDRTGYVPPKIANPNVGPMALRRGFRRALTPSLETVAATNQTVVPGITTLVLTQFTPTISLSDNKNFIPGVRSLIVTPFASKSVIGVYSYPSVRALTTSGLAPTIVVSNNKISIPNVVSLTTTRFAPGVAVSNNMHVVPGVASLTTTKFAPTITAGASRVVVPGTRSLSLTSLVPVIVTPRTVVPGVRALTLTKYTPQLRLAVIPGTRSLTAVRFAPVILANVSYIPSLLILHIQSFAPVMAIGLTPGNGSTNVSWTPSPTTTTTVSAGDNDTSTTWQPGNMV
jgi:hypothetical protein